MFFFFEFAPRSNISNGTARQRLTWPQRISAAIGVAKGIQFLHAGIILFGNNLKILNVLLDQNTLAKICCYNLPVVEQGTQMECCYFRVKQEEPQMVKGTRLKDILLYSFVMLLWRCGP